jgi:hypothetical protein
MIQAPYPCEKFELTQSFKLHTNAIFCQEARVCSLTQPSDILLENLEYADKKDAGRSMLQEPHLILCAFPGYDKPPGVDIIIMFMRSDGHREIVYYIQ